MVEISNPKLRRRRRSRTSNEEAIAPTVVTQPQPDIIDIPETTETTDVTETEDLPEIEQAPENIPKSSISDTYNELRSEFTDAERNSLIEDDYSDDTHDWLDSASSEYANFLGRWE